MEESHWIFRARAINLGLYGGFSYSPSLGRDLVRGYRHGLQPADGSGRRVGNDDGAEAE